MSSLYKEARAWVFDVLFGHFYLVVEHSLLKLSPNQSAAGLTDVSQGQHCNFFIKNLFSCCWRFNEELKGRIMPLWYKQNSLFGKVISLVSSLTCSGFQFRDHLVESICRVSHIKLWRKQTEKLTATQLLMFLLYLFNSLQILGGAVRLCVLIRGFIKTGWIHQKWRVHLWRKQCAVWKCVSDSCRTPPRRFFFWKGGNLTVLRLSPWKRREGLIRVVPEKSVFAGTKPQTEKKERKKKERRLKPSWF